RVVAAGGGYVLIVKDNQPSLAVDIAAGLAFEDQARRQQAAVFPLPRGGRAAGVGGADRGQGARAVGGQDAAPDGRLDERPGLGGPRSGVRADAPEDGEGRDERGGGARHNEPAARAGGRRAADGAGA